MIKRNNFCLEYLFVLGKREDFLLQLGKVNELSEMSGQL